jgi:hypothetical protein
MSRTRRNKVLLREGLTLARPQILWRFDGQRGESDLQRGWGISRWGNVMEARGRRATVWMHDGSGHCTVPKRKGRRQPPVSSLQPSSLLQLRADLFLSWLPGADEWNEVN